MKRLRGVRASDRNRWFKSSEKLFLKALNSQLDSFLFDFVRTGKPHVSTIQEKPIRDAMVETYGDVGAHFALATLNSVSVLLKDYDIKKRRRRFIRNPDGTTTEIIESTWVSFMRRIALQEMGEKITGITGYTREWVLRATRDALEVGVSQGLGIEKIARLIRERWTGTPEAPGISIMRARRIAQTEVVGASNRGSYEGAKATGLALEKVWLAKMVRTRPDHVSMHNKAVDIDAKFPIGGGMEYPGDPAGDADNVINCHCTIVYNVLE